MLKKRLIEIFCLSLIWVIPSAFAQTVGSVDEVIEPIGDKGQVNWTLGIIQATGMGAFPDDVSNPVQRLAMARRAAVTVARRNLLEVTKGIRIDSETTVENFMITSDDIKTSVDGFVRGATVVKETNLVGGGVQVTVQIKLKGAFGEVVLSDALQDVPDRLLPPSATQPPAEGVFTGLVVDARGLGVRPAMAPKIIDEDDREVYGSARVSRDFAVQQGMAGYTKSLESAGKNDRVTNNPLFVKGIRADGGSKSNIIIASADAEKIRSAARHLNFLEKCKVMIVVD
jgi:hypothetical protein